MSKELRQRVAVLAENWAQNKVRYLHRGTTEQGCDCTGLIIGIVQSMGHMKNYVLRQYSPDWNLHAGAGNYIMEELKKVAIEIHDVSLEPGDILVFRFGKCLAHVGILINPFSMLFVHSLYTVHCKYDLAINSIWASRLVATYRLDETKIRSFD